MRTKQGTIASAERQALMPRFARWDVDRKLTQRGHTGDMPAAVMLRTKQRVTVAIQFLEWLEQRDVDLPGCTQHDLVTSFGNGPTTRWHSTPFINWSRKQRILRGITIPPRSIRTSPTIGSSQDGHHAAPGRRRLERTSRTDRHPPPQPSRGRLEHPNRRQRRHELAVPRRHARLAVRHNTWLQPVREAPPAVLAQTLGISPRTAMQHATRAGTDYQAYAASRSREEWN
jgi:hypothetical protein